MYNKLIPGSYAIRTTEDTIYFSIGKRAFGISRTNFMNSELEQMNCIFEVKKQENLYPLRQVIGNRFFFGKYCEFDIRINFNDLQIRKNSNRNPFYPKLS